MNRSKDRHTVAAQNYLKRCLDKGDTPDPGYLNIYAEASSRDLAREHDLEWQQNNLEYDLRSTQWICDKAKARQEYAQNIYAALCNQSWQRNAQWPLLKGQHWSCSWRYAGGIVADIREEGDYIDWYCTGIRGGAQLDDIKLTEEQKARIEWYDKHFVGEGVITNEIREDFFRLGWIPVDDNQD